MDDPRLVAELAGLDVPVEPSQEFAEGLWLRLRAELDDPALRVPVVGGTLHAAGLVATRPSRARTVATVAAAFLAAVAIGGALWWLSPGGGDDPIAPSDSTPVTSVPSTSTTSSPTSTLPGAEVSVGGDILTLPEGMRPIDAAFDGTLLWVLASIDPPVPPGNQPPDVGRVLSLDSNGLILTDTELSGSPTLIAADDSGVWVAHWGTGSVTRLDPATGDVVATVTLELPADLDFGSGADDRRYVPNRIAIGHGAVWVTTFRGAIARIDPGTNEVTGNLALHPAGPSDLAVGSEWIWVAESEFGVTHIDPSALDAVTIPLDHLAYDIASTGDIYVGGEFDVTRLDQVDGRILGHAAFDERVVMIGWVDAFFGVLDETGAFWHLVGSGGLVHSGAQTNWGGGPVHQIDREAVELDADNGRIVAVRETGPAFGELPVPLGSLISPVTSTPPPAPDWVELDPGPLGAASAIVNVWSGTELILWGVQDRPDDVVSPIGAAYDVANGIWRELAPLPTEMRQVIYGPVASVWTGEEVVIWDQSDGIAYDPVGDTWRVIDAWPQFIAVSSRMIYVWDGQEVLDLKGSRAVSPVDGAVREIAAPGSIHERATAVWTGDVAVTVTSNGMYGPAVDTWTAMPASGLTPLSVAGAWTGDRVLAVDYLMNAAEFDPVTNTWERLPEVPIRGGECGSAVHLARRDLGIAVDPSPIASICAALAVWDESRGGWVPLQLPTRWQSTISGSDGSTLYARDAHTGDFWRLDRSVLEPGTTPARLAVGIGALDVPDGWDLVTATADDEQHHFEMAGPGGERCVIDTGYSDAKTVVGSYLGAGGEIDEIARRIDDRTVPAVVVANGERDDDFHVVIVQGTSDVVDVSCAVEAAARFLAGHLWN